MMQQQIYQQEQSPAQDSTGQMVLCPVRVVYETQMLVQPGEQMQPNQTILINPQNPPPWIQNRTVPNQVIYVQQMPTNYVQQSQQHYDPNQLQLQYLQNFGYQNMQPMFVQTPQDQIRPMQMIQPNVLQNIQSNINTNAQNQRIIPNTAQHTISHVNTIQNHNVPITRQITHNQIAHMNELVNNIRPPDGQTIYRPPVPQSIQQEPKVQIQQNITMVPPNNMQSAPRFPQGYEQNIAQIRSPAQQSVTNVSPPYQNTIVNLQDNKKIISTTNKGNQHQISNVGVKGSQTFRPIQPRTNQIRTNGPNIISVQPTNNMLQHSMPNVGNASNIPRKMLPNNVPLPNSISISSCGKIEGNNIPINRKRKSESPDEVHKKISISNQTENPIIIKRLENVSSNVNCSDVGVNTSPIHRPDGRILINNLEITPMKQSNIRNAKIIEELSKPVNSNTTVTEPENINRNNSIATLSHPILPVTDKEKLVRNTVYTQARGRVLNDKETKIEIQSVKELENKETVDTLPADKVNNEISLKQETNITKEINLNESEKPENNSSVTKTETKVANLEEIKANIIQSQESKTNTVLKEEKNFILTHVLDGYVIQESNIAFPIRKPLKEKSLQNNTGEIEPKKDVNKEKETAIKNNSKILDISHLQIKEIEDMNTVKDNDNSTLEKENPFKTLKLNTLKTWTADQLANHLSKFTWNETVSVLQEHEIDGESLLLVSKAQLLTIGINEEHADIICEFVKS